ncbi:MAG TPA: gephyrin-like molybdotransferase Glp [Candidatus Eisenbacteria bacterium]|nr:gephyrin-like molybdotransferase Glp [Candidatus Eisenbacteria bacterium]
MLELEEAVARILAAVPAPVTESVPVADAHHRVLTEPFRLAIDLPPFDNSAMDGYAVRAEDVKSAKPESPVSLRLIGRVAAGGLFEGQVTTGTCVRLFTGAPMPKGADAVVMQEDTRSDSNAPDRIQILDSAKPWENVRLQGEDAKRGALAAEPGEILTIGHINLLAATGRTEIKVGRQPTIGILSTGSELKQAGEPLALGQIYESNRIGLATLVRRSDAIAKIFPLVPDTLKATRAALEMAFQTCDLLVTSGGVSVGEMDFLKQAFAEIGGELQFWKIAIRPGRPFVFGRHGAKFFFGLPGNPISALVTFLLLVRPAILRWQGAKDVNLPTHPGVLAEAITNSGDRRHFMRVKVDATGKVASAGLQASHALSSMAGANALLDIPPKTNLPAGQPVPVLRWEF